MIPFDFKLFLFELRLTKFDLSKLLNVPNPTVYIMCNRGTIKPSFLRKIEVQFGDCSKYILTDQRVGKEVA
jgi:hypothetical protein